MALNKLNSYYRKTCPKITLKLWQILEEMDSQLNEKQFNELLINEMKQLFDKTIDEKDSKKLITNALKDKLIIEDINQFNYGLRFAFISIFIINLFVV
jgi:hypothetical protein